MDRILRKPAQIAAALLLLPALLVAQTPDQRIDRAMERARSVGVPVALLESKLAEGRAKGVPLERIAPAIEHRLDVLEQVKTGFGDRFELTSAELGVAGDALQAGVSVTALAALSERAPRDRRAVAIAVLTELVQQGQASEIALARVTEALERGGDALGTLPAQSSGRGNANGRSTDATGRGVGSQGSGRGSGPPAGVPPGQSGDNGRGRGRGGPPPPGEG